MILNSQEASSHPVGGKARALAKLGQAFPIPAWLVIPPDAFQLLSDEQKQAVVEGNFSGISFPESLKNSLMQHLSHLKGQLWAVRSSALDEDGAQASFAGQFDSFLNVPTDQVPEHVLKVWHSGFAARSEAYRREQGMTGGKRVPAVLIQRMVQAETAGVCFSADPVTSDRTRCVISAIQGLGDRLVSGEEDGQTYTLLDSGEIEKPGNPILTDAQVQQIAALARKSEAFFGMPQDIEWAIEKGQVFLLQSRPITTLETVTWWDNSNIIESYSGVTTPLTFSFASRAYRTVYRHFVRMLGVPERSILQNGHVFDVMIGLVQGRIYYNLSNWYRVLGMLPGFSINRRFMEQMMGVADGMPPELKVQTSNGALRDTLYLLRTVAGLGWTFNQLPGSRARFYTRLKKQLGVRKHLPAMSYGQLADHYRTLEAELLNRWDAPLSNDFFAMIFYGVLRQLCSKWLSDSGGALQNDLVSAEGQMISAVPAQKLEEMASLLRSEPGLLEVFQQGSRAEILQALGAAPELQTQFHTYLREFGERCLDELKLESLTLQDEPEMLARMVARLALTPPVAHDARARREQAEQIAREKLSGWRERLFFWVLRHARECVRERENMRFERTRVFGEARKIFRSMGAQLVKMNLLDDPEDVFYLTVDELLGYAEGTAVTLNFRVLAQARKAEFEVYRAQPSLPRRFRSAGSVYRQSLKPAGSSSLSSTERQGIPCSPGVVRGTVRVVRDPRTINLSEPTILVAERTDPGWIIILPLARALLVERGSLLSHSAIVSRELGIPGIVSIPEVTAWLQDGDEVELDGSTGVVKRIRRAGEGQALQEEHA
ncbi:PEP/pyruvate-binding domain-containing protein [Deinococcus cellulosilyticus]|uniref:Phosphoenolpyruvate synthase n=1 Tax=Deinococcus cellulosilyticus (strain DSM 18568 / NBRC 106333 / KACC 11606 / 5516J-15) TaxID=1223518 RepID=A0A511N073_DEIC1|nr:PEP/pyruvate-binding domain-containing protein [Deinococcus cellulosilyticus]GEM45837.1 phosphoenolpyruvate synthase [Deinococcus cellulosilyticus NBRC 106333 = KACC 11606]